MKDLTNQRFGSLTAVRFSHYTGKYNAHWVYQCDCGKEHLASSSTIKAEAKRLEGTEFPSCGCKRKAKITTHGYTVNKIRHPCYKVYTAMMSRCYCVGDHASKNYLGKGVTVCPEWKDNPEAFVEWAIASGWQKGLVLDKDMLCEAKGVNPKVYSPDTCQWITRGQNSAFGANRSNYGNNSTIKISPEQALEIRELFYSGKVTNRRELARMFGVKAHSTIINILK